MERAVGTTARGIRAPIIKEGDDLVNIVVDSLLKAMKTENFSIKDRDVIGITESLVARAQGNYATIHDIAYDISRKFKGDIAVLFPILSRNRFSLILKGIALSGKKVYLFLNYPSDEVGNHIMDVDVMDELGVNPYTDILSEEKYRELFGEKVEHPFTGIDYVSYYEGISSNNNIEIILANDPRVALDYTKEILVANIHERKRTKRILKDAGAETIYGLDDILNISINGSGFNPDYGLLGSNTATEEKVKLFPKDCQELVTNIQKAIKDKTGKQVEVMVYGDGAFKDPAGKIWELADPVVSPGYTDGLKGTPNEIKLKYIADNELSELNENEREEAIKQKIREKESNSAGKAETLGTTPRQLTDLLGSLCDLISGSGDKGTPIVLIQGYFDSYAAE
ncbi:F420-0:Gamma-glutamyl ligase [Proteiniborus ethanoligenes]|uniref:F420-0:Gamma-glutamyl ligase n=1 Tax=Proteiniborus ethanoligenes TaxID=415015 RepID=A0A1H3RA92_9FIRM|nr:coenzyme F420-0:L-glutamate ligase [Proteiniborus ethanoligenes]TAH63813.1 MAG: F420-0--gamma-glutamyl ligase [Gottschalkiaceae bacterium]SDZ22560.1 F420-0:Gamma-glutamyl ligase [Proteiniborus ethanoligenes]